MKKEIVITAIIFLILFMKPKKTSTGASGAVDAGDEEVRSGLQEVIYDYGFDNAKTIERLLRLETAHFKSGQWKQTATPGMEIAKGKYTFPYGWSSLKEFADIKGLAEKDFSTWTSPENQTGIIKTFIRFPNARLGIQFLAYVLNKRGWNAGSWYSTDPAKQQSYIAKLNTITPKIVNFLFQ